MPRYLGLERDSIRIRGFENNAVHGLLQAEVCAAAQMNSARVVEERTSEAVERCIQTRMQCKQLLVAEDREVSISRAAAQD
ncbi:Scr1 family TA system antitoxin-like transcriptional regulator [Streptomyces sp. NPDC013161]|uniref:Scr1 family TA system antitoxin-like transcriptional regulator n=1 Tax=Streptomyces sp. NPDC013161 TaxID=3364862 RepID=UPI0036B98C51